MDRLYENYHRSLKAGMNNLIDKHSNRYSRATVSFNNNQFQSQPRSQPFVDSPHLNRVFLAQGHVSPTSSPNEFSPPSPFNGTPITVKVAVSDSPCNMLIEFIGFVLVLVMIAVLGFGIYFAIRLSNISKETKTTDE